MSDEIIGAIIQSIAMIVAVIIGFYITRKTKRLDWHEEQAEKFLICSRDYSETISKLLHTLSFFFGNYERIASQQLDYEEKVSDMISKIGFLEWELIRYSIFSKKEKEQFLKNTKDLFQSVANLIDFVTKRSSEVVNLEEIRLLQNIFDESACKLHAELCLIK